MNSTSQQRTAAPGNTGNVGGTSQTKTPDDAERLKLLQQKYPWVSLATSEYVELSAAERIAFIRSEHFVRHAQMARAIDAMNYVFTQPRRRRMECVFIGGQSGVGKTMVAKRFLKENGIEVSDVDGLHVITRAGGTKVVTVDLSGVSTEEGLYGRIAEACLEPGASALKYSPEGVLRMVADLGAQTVLFDEADRLTELPIDVQKGMIAQMKYLTNNAQVGIIALGAKKLKNFISSEDTLLRRFGPELYLTPLVTATQVREFVVNLCRRMPMRQLPRVDNMRFLTALVEAAGRRQTDVARMVKATAIHAIVTTKSECLDLGSLRKAIENPYIHQAPPEDGDLD